MVWVMIMVVALDFSILRQVRVPETHQQRKLRGPQDGIGVLEDDRSHNSWSYIYEPLVKDSRLYCSDFILNSVSC
jgi:hypothetical protein